MFRKLFKRMGQNDSKSQNKTPPGYQNYDPQMINNYLNYHHQHNPQFLMQAPYQQPNGGYQQERAIQCGSVPNSVISVQNNNNEKPLKLNEPSVNPKVEKVFKNYDSSKSTMLQELLECPICMNTFDNPHVLPCQHTFCKECIVSLKNNDKNTSESISCPICRESHTLLNGINGLAANYTMKKLIEMESMASAEREKSIAASLEKEKAKSSREKKAKCFVCQKHAHLKVCTDCSYMLCHECSDNPDHEILIESKLNLKKRNKYVKNFAAKYEKTDSPTNNGGYDNKKNKVQKYASYKPELSEQSEPMDDYDNKKNKVQKYASYRPELSDQSEPMNDCLKLVLLVHSSEIENNLRVKKSFRQEMFEDEYGKCSTFTKISVFANDRIITLKKIIEKKFGILCHNQILVNDDRIMKDDLKFLNDFRLKQFDKIHIFDERDLEENDLDEIENELYGIYEDFSNLSESSLGIKNNNADRDEFENSNQKRYTGNYKENKALMEPARQLQNSLYSRHFYNEHSQVDSKVYNRPDKYASQRKYRNRD